MGGKRLTLPLSAELRAQPEKAFGWKGRAAMVSLQGEPHFASSSWLIDICFSGRIKWNAQGGNRCVREWACKQLVAEILEREECSGNLR